MPQIIHRPSVKGVLPCCKKTPGEAAAEEDARTIFVSTVKDFITCGRK